MRGSSIIVLQLYRGKEGKAAISVGGVWARLCPRRRREKKGKGLEYAHWEGGGFWFSKGGQVGKKSPSNYFV